MKDLGGRSSARNSSRSACPSSRQTIQNIQKAKPDWLLTINVGAAQDRSSSRRLRPSSTCRWASSIKVMLGFEHKRFKPPALNNMHAAANWFEEIDTPAAKDFKKRWHAKFPNELYINDMGYNAYNALYMYKALVEKAKSTKLDDLRKVIATGDACIDAPEGKICIDPKSQHTSHHMRLISVGPKHEVQVDKDYGMIQPYWLGEIGCDLTKKNDKDAVHAEQSPEEVVTCGHGSCSCPSRALGQGRRRNDAAPWIAERDQDVG